MPFPHQHLAQTISDQLNVLAAQLKTRTRASQNDANHWLESVMARFFNALFGWDLVNLNADQPNFPAADLGDRKRRIAMQITNQDAASKITETAKKAEVHQLGEAFDQLILFFLLPEKPSMPKSFVQPPAGPAIECWDLADLLKQMPELKDQSCLSAAAAVLEKELGHQSASKEPPPSNLPGGYIGQLFVGRETFLDDLRTSLLKQTQSADSSRQPAATVIVGLGGMGKTHVAMKYVELHRDKYTALLFVSGDSSQRLQASLAGLCEEVRGLNLHSNLPADEKERARIALDWLASNPGWLLIVDNVDDEEAALALTAYFDWFRIGHLLITSRLGIWSPQVEPLTLLELSPEEAADLLLKRTDKHRRKATDDATHARTLADVMEGLPLALQQAASYIIEKDCTFAEYLSIYKNEEKAIELLGWFNSLSVPYEGPDKQVKRPVIVTWKTSFDQLTDETRRWLLVFSHFAHDPIPEFLLDTSPEANDAVKTRHRAARESLAEARKFCLLTRLDNPPSFKFHRLVQEVIRCTSSDEKCAIALAQAILLINEADPGDAQDVRTWTKWSLLQSHAQAICFYAPNEPVPEGLTWLLGELSMLLLTKYLFEQAEPLMRRALQLDEASLSCEHPFFATRLNNLGHLLQVTNRLEEAEPLLRRYLSIVENRVGPEHPDIAIGLNNLAQLLQATNRLVEAESLMRRALQIDDISYGSAHTKVAIRLNNLATLLHGTNRLEEAEPLMRRALQIDEAFYGPEHPQVAIGLNNLAQLLQDMNRLTEAEPLIRRALQTAEASYGPKHGMLATFLNNLVVLLKSTNRLEEAEPLIHRALKIAEATYGSKHPIVANCLINLATLLQSMNRLTEAEPIMRRSLVIFMRSLSLVHPNMKKFLGDYAQILLALKLPVAEIAQRIESAMNEA